MDPATDDSWEDALFQPPQWPYHSGDNGDEVPGPCPRTNSYGYNARDLDALPVQAGYARPARRPRPAVSEPEAAQYYSQFEVIRDVMLGEYSPAQPHCPRHQTSDMQVPGRGCHGHRHHHRQQHPRRVDADRSDGSSSRSASAESGSTAVSQDSDSTGGCCSSSELDDRLVGARSPQSQASASSQHATVSAVQWRRSRTGSTTAAVVLRLPLLVAALAIIVAEMALYFVVRQLIAARENVFVWRGHLGRLLASMAAAGSYNEYMRYAMMVDAHMAIDLGDPATGAQYYDAPLLSHVTQSLREARLLADDLRESNAEGARSAAVALGDVLRQGALKANSGGWENREVWSCAYSGTPRIVDDYISEVVTCVQRVKESPHLQPAEKLVFFRQVARQQGRTALCLSGGASMGWKHLGVARCLLDEARLPRVISGTSAGSLVAALLGTHTDDELRRVIRPGLVKYMTACQGPVRENLARWWARGYYFDAAGWAPRAQVFTRGTLTFLEAFERTSKILNITCTPIGHRYSPHKLLNYITAPNVLIWSAVLASASLPGVVQPMVLLMKTRDGRIRPYTDSGALWRDGSFRNDIPGADLRAQLNVQFTVVSQVNPHITLFFYDCVGSIGQPAPSGRRSIWGGGFVLSAAERILKLDVRKWLRVLRDLSLMPLILGQDWSYIWLQKFDGDVTVLPAARLSENLRLLLDPTPESLTKSMWAGQVAMWPKLRMIETRQAVEDAITDGWVEAYYACARSSDAMRSMPPHQVMAVARAARTVDESCPQDQQASFLDALEAIAPAAVEAENGADLKALFSVRARSTSPGLHKSSGQARRSPRQTMRRTATSPFAAAHVTAAAAALRAKKKQKKKKKLPAHLAATREPCNSCPPAVVEDVWTG